MRTLNTDSTYSFRLHNLIILMPAYEALVSTMISKNVITRLTKVSCIIQFANALMDYMLWFNTGFTVPSRTTSNRNKHQSRALGSSKTYRGKRTT
jgi:hypothetical protein